MAATYQRRHAPPIKIGRQTAYILSTAWIVLSVLYGVDLTTLAALVILTVSGGHIGDRVGNAYQDAES